MKERTIELLLLVGIVLLSAFIVIFLTKQFVAPFASQVVEGFQSAATAGAASPPPDLQKMMMVLIGPGGGTNGADGDVFLSKIGTDFTDPVWETYPPAAADTRQTVSKLPLASKIRIDGGGVPDSWLNFQKIRIFDATNTNVNSRGTATASSVYGNGITNAPSNILSAGPTDIYHSADQQAWLEVNLSTPTQLSRIEIDNRTDCCQTRLAAYILRVYDASGNEFFSRPLSAGGKQTYTLNSKDQTITVKGGSGAASTPVASITGGEGRLYATNSASAIFATKPNTNTSEGVWNTVPGGLKQVSRDGHNVCGVNTANDIWFANKNIEFNPNWAQIKDQAKWISISNGRAACIGTNDIVRYTRNYMEGNGASVWWQDVQNNLGQRPMKQVVLDDTRIGAIDMEGIIYMADLGESGTMAPDGGLLKMPRWFQVGGKKARFIEMRLGRVLIIGDDDGKLYYSDDYRYGRWQSVPMPANMREVYMAAKDSGFGYSLSKDAAAATCTGFGATLANGAQLQAAWRNGANWCSCAWTTDIGRQYPNNEFTQMGCGGPKPGIKDCGTWPTDGGGTANCFGKKPASGTGNVARFNTKFWNAPPLAIEFVPFSSTYGSKFCGTEGTAGIFKGEKFRYYSRQECATVGRRFTDGRTTEYNPAIGECRIVGRYSCYNYTEAELARINAGVSEKAVCEVNGRVYSQGDETKAPGCGSCWCCAPPPAPAPLPLSLSRQVCANLPDVPEKAAVTQQAMELSIKDNWDDGSTGNCVFNPDEYKKKYGLTGDIGQVYQHWLDTGLAAGYSPCGDINPSCRWDPDTYYKMNPTARGQAPRDPLQHYKEIGIRQGLKFCNAAGVMPLLDVFAKLFETRKVVAPPANIAAQCTSTAITVGPAQFETREVFLVAVPAGITQGNAPAKCAEFGASLATRQQLKDAQLNGANWCLPGWIQIEPDPYHPISISGSCGGASETDIRVGSRASVTGVNCYGKKPSLVENSPLRYFNGKQWSLYSMTATQAAAKRWTCANRAFADRMFAGPGNSDEVYLGRDDVVCFTDNPETKTYYCRSTQEYRNGEDYTSDLADSYDKSCNVMSQALADLSGAITTIENIKGGLESGAKTIGDAASTLNQVYTKYNCSSATPEMKAMCNVLEASRAKVMASSQAISSTEAGKEGIYNVVLAPMAAATSSRETILGTMRKIQCPV
jgi:hypothetical protein